MTEQGQSGKWDYRYEPVISIAFLNFATDRLNGQWLTDGEIVDRHSGKPITDRMRLIFIQLPEFRQDSPEECTTLLEQWVYMIKNIKNMDSIPFYNSNPIFRRVDELARKENLSKEERREYERSLKYYRDYQNHYDQGMRLSHEKGREEGHAAGIFEEKMRFARELVLCSYPLEEIARLTRLPLGEIEKLLRND